jgi:hypothetical protein
MNHEKQNLLVLSSCRSQKILFGTLPYLPPHSKFYGKFSLTPCYAEE